MTQINQIHLQGLANEFGLFASCGSDFHGPGISFRQMGQMQTLPANCDPIWNKWPLTEGVN